MNPSSNGLKEARDVELRRLGQIAYKDKRANGGVLPYGYYTSILNPVAALAKLLFIEEEDVRGEIRRIEMEANLVVDPSKMNATPGARNETRNLEMEEKPVVVSSQGILNARGAEPSEQLLNTTKTKPLIDPLLEMNAYFGHRNIKNPGVRGGVDPSHQLLKRNDVQAAEPPQKKYKKASLSDDLKAARKVEIRRLGQMAYNEKQANGGFCLPHGYLDSIIHPVAKSLFINKDVLRNEIKKIEKKTKSSAAAKSSTAATHSSDVSKDAPTHGVVEPSSSTTTEFASIKSEVNTCEI